MNKLTTLLMPATLLLGAAFSQPAVAQTAPAHAPSVAVVHADLDLSNSADRERLQRRLRIAARQVCGTGFDFDLRSQNAARECTVLTLQSIDVPMPNVLASAE